MGHSARTGPSCIDEGLREGRLLQQTSRELFWSNLEDWGWWAVWQRVATTASLSSCSIRSVRPKSNSELAQSEMRASSSPADLVRPGSIVQKEFRCTFGVHVSTPCPFFRRGSGRGWGRVGGSILSVSREPSSFLGVGCMGGRYILTKSIWIPTTINSSINAVTDPNLTARCAQIARAASFARQFRT